MMPVAGRYLDEIAPRISRYGATLPLRPRPISRRLISSQQYLHRLRIGPSRKQVTFTLGHVFRDDGSRLRSIATAVASSTKDVTETLPVMSRASLPPPSPEQQFAIDTLLQTGSNIVVDAMAGSGKTTTILHLAKAAPHMRFLVLVYNRRLMIETQERADSLGLDNITIYNYHTLGARYYTSECSTDQGLKRVVEDDMTVFPGKTLPDFSVLVMDEQQDLTPILKRFVDKLIRDKGFALKNHRLPASSEQLRLVVLGDQRQQIYSFNNADSRFLTMAGRPEVFGYVNDQSWVSAPQTYSNRITEQNTDFINDQLLKSGMGAPPMRAARKVRRDGSIYPKPRYIVCDPEEEVLVEIERFLISGFQPADILVLAPSTRGRSPAKMAANQLALQGIPVHRADSDITSPSANVLHGKVLVCTYHQSKGIERPVCIVLGFDQQYHTWYDKQSEPLLAVSNPQYVAATRAIEHLVLLHDSKWPPLPFIDLDTIGDTCDYIVRQPLANTVATEVSSVPAKPKIPRYSVIALCRNLSETVITQCLQKLQIQQLVQPVFAPSAPPTEILDKYGLVEWTAAITGTAVPALFEWFQRRKLTILDDISPSEKGPKQWIQTLPIEYQQRLEHIRQKVDTGKELSVSDILYVAHLSMADIDRDFVSLLSIPLDKYTWISDSYFGHVVSMLKHIPKPANITKTARYELYRPRKFLDIQVGSSHDPGQSPGILLGGRMDVVRLRKEEDNIVWEVKHMDTLHPEHIIQTALYILLLNRARGYLVSARSGHTVEVTPKSSTSLHEMLQILVGAKSGGPQAKLLHKYSDEEFLAEAAQDFAGLVGKCALPAWFSMKPQRSVFKRGRYKHGVEEPAQDDDAGLTT